MSPAGDTPAFDLAEVESGIAGTPFSGQVHHVRLAESTMDLAAAGAAAGARCGVWVADAQTRGRGRGGHGWHSVAGQGLYLSALVRLAVPMRSAREIPLATGLAVQAAVQEVTGLALDLRWPNDLMFAERKCGGILVESTAGEREAGWPEAVGPALRWAVIGIGLNVGQERFPAELQAIATSLRMESGRLFRREDLLPAILCRLSGELDGVRRSWEGTASGPGTAARFEAASTWVRGKRVAVEAREGEPAFQGITRGLDGEGFLRVETRDGLVRVVRSGGVRPAR